MFIEEQVTPCVCRARLFSNILITLLKKTTPKISPHQGKGQAASGSALGPGSYLVGDLVILGKISHFLKLIFLALESVFVSNNIIMTFTADHGSGTVLRNRKTLGIRPKKCGLFEFVAIDLEIGNSFPIL